MTDARGLFRRYLEQQRALGAGPVVLNAVPAATPPPVQPEGATRTVEEPPPPPPPPEDTHMAPPPPRRAPKKEPSARQRRPSDDPPAIPERGLEVAAPAKDLFTNDPLANASLEDIGKIVSTCTKCPLHEGRTNAVPGEGPADADLVVVGEGPGANEDAQGRPFVGRAGDLLNDILAAIKCPRETVYIANIVKCRPPSNRKPATDECTTCVPYLHRQLEIIGPKVILAMGGTAAETLLNIRASLSSLRNKVHEYRGTPLIVTYHPAALLRNPHWKRPTWDDVRIARQLLDR